MWDMWIGHDVEAADLPPCAPTYDLKVRCCCRTLYQETKDDPTNIPAWFARGLGDLAVQGGGHAGLEAGGLGALSALEETPTEPMERGLGGGAGGAEDEEKRTDSEAESAVLFQQPPGAEGVT